MRCESLTQSMAVNLICPIPSVSIQSFRINQETSSNVGRVLRALWLCEWLLRRRPSICTNNERVKFQDLGGGGRYWESMGIRATIANAPSHNPAVTATKRRAVTIKQ